MVYTLVLSSVLFCGQRVQAREPASVPDAARSTGAPEPIATINSFRYDQSVLGVKADLVKAALPSLVDANPGNSSLGDQFRCHTTDSDPLLDVCADALVGSRYRLGDKAQGFRIYNGTDREKRHWEFKFPNQARQDMMFQIDDYPYISDLMIIPRTHSPSVIQLGNTQMQVTLPNDDKIIINRATGKIASGDIQENNNSRPPDLSYTGKGYLIKVQGKEGLSLNGVPAPSLQTATKAVITRNGKSCSVDPSELWPNRKSHNGFPKFKFPKDEDFEKWLKNNSRCKNLAQ